MINCPKCGQPMVRSAQDDINEVTCTNAACRIVKNIETNKYYKHGREVK